MDAQAADYDLEIPARLSDEPAAPLRLRMKMAELGLIDSHLIDSLGIWQANAVLNQLRARWLAEEEARRAAQQRRARGVKIILGLLGVSAALGVYLRFA